MAKIDEVKIIIGILEKVLITFLIGLFSMISYLFINIEKLDLIKMIFLSVGIIAILFIIGYFTMLLLKRTRELKDL